jgi:hypothetical protein
MGLQTYNAYARVTCSYLYALRRAGFSLREIQRMSPKERRELGALALASE